MCLILVAWQTHPQLPFVVAANRDEYFKRRTASVDFWHDAPEVLAGRDLEAGGTWLGITRRGRFAALTNFRDPARNLPDAPSRGRLVADFLTSNMNIDDWLDRFDADVYNGFNLLLGDGRQLIAFSNVCGTRHVLAPGIYGLSNAKLDTPWPKVVSSKSALQRALDTLPDERPLARLLQNGEIHPDASLPATGVPLEWERLLSAAFVRSPTYGTRCSTTLKVDAHDTLCFDEQTWLPGAQPGTRRRIRCKLVR